jgi:hypothetical protein
MVAATSTNTAGFILWSIGFTVVAWIASLSASWYRCRHYKEKKHFKEALKESWLTGIFLTIGVVTVIGLYIRA